MGKANKVKWVTYKVIEGNLTLGGAHTMEYT